MCRLVCVFQVRMQQRFSGNVQPGLHLSCLHATKVFWQCAGSSASFLFACNKGCLAMCSLVCIFLVRMQQIFSGNVQAGLPLCCSHATKVFLQRGGNMMWKNIKKATKTRQFQTLKKLTSVVIFSYLNQII